MELDLHLLIPRYESLRSASKRKEARLLAAIDKDGQQCPAVVTACSDGRFVLVDGYKRLRALRKLHIDLIKVSCWDLPEHEALLMDRLMQTGDRDSVLEQGWLLQLLRDRFHLTMEELARRFDRGISWVSGRLGLVSDLPESLQQMVRDGRLNAHATMKHLLPLARLDSHGAVDLANAIAPLQLSSRQTQAICSAYARGNRQARQYLLQRPEAFLRAREKEKLSIPKEKGELLLRDMGLLREVAHRALSHLGKDALGSLLPPEREELRAVMGATRGELRLLWGELDKEMTHAG